VAFGLAILGCFLNLPLPLLIQSLVDHVAAGSRATALPFYALGLLAVFALQAGVSLANTFVIGRVGLHVVRELRHRIYAHLQKATLSFYDRTASGAIISRLMDDVAWSHRFTTYPVLDGGRPVGLLTFASVAAVPRSDWDTRRVRDTMISPQPSQYHAGIRWPHHNCREMHQSRMLRIHSKYVFAQLDGTNSVLPCSTAAIAGSANGLIFTNHCVESSGSTTV